MLLLWSSLVVGASQEVAKPLTAATGPGACPPPAATLQQKRLKAGDASDAHVDAGAFGLLDKDPMEVCLGFVVCDVRRVS